MQLQCVWEFSALDSSGINLTEGRWVGLTRRSICFVSSNPTECDMMQRKFKLCLFQVAQGSMWSHAPQSSVWGYGKTLHIALSLEFLSFSLPPNSECIFNSSSSPLFLVVSGRRFVEK